MKKTVLVCLLGLVALMSAMAAGKKEAVSDDDYAIKVGVPVTGTLCSAPLFIAYEKGFYAEEGLTIEEIKIDWNQRAQLLTLGRIDATQNLAAAMIAPIANGLDVKIPLALHTGCIKALVPPDSPIKTPADLKGKRIGTESMNASATIIVQRYLAELGIGSTTNNLEVEWLIYPNSELALAMERGQIDAMTANDPIASIVEASGKGRAIIDTGKDAYLKDEYCCMLIASSTIAKEHPLALAKFTRAIQRAAYWVQEHPDETARLMGDAQYVAGDPVLNGKILASYNYRAVVSDARTAILRNARDMQRIGLIDADIDVEALTQGTFIALPGVPNKL
ncbi:ABC transporter substrate-binding protein [Spirochaetia bacterium]|nr:ABC transporter substrate-binding protein [Spirochaetia bacterium]